MIVISSALVPAQQSGDVDGDLPAVGWRNVVTAGSIVADTQEANFPASNLANPATHLEWRAADDSEQYLTVTTNETDDIDYVGIAKHNFGSAEIVVSVEAYDGANWNEIVEEVLLPDDSPVMLRFEAQSIGQIRVRLQTGSENPRAAVVYVGKLLDLERKVYVGHTPLIDAVEQEVANGRSESGNFLGRIVLGEWTESPVPLSLISPDWFRENMRPFLASAKERPFFFAWRPASYPFETGYAWFTGSLPKPSPAGPSNLIAMDWRISGVV